MTPVYLVGKILAVIGSVYTLWQLGFHFDTPEAKVAMGLGLSAIGSLFENNPVVNQVLNVITSLLGLKYTPDPATPSVTPPPSEPKV